MGKKDGGVIREVPAFMAEQPGITC
jgi:hypothetical protein